LEPEKKRKGEHKREDTKGRAQAKKDNENGKSESIILKRSELKKKEEYWDYVRQFEIVSVVEIWVEERSWEKIEKWLPKEYKWECQGAKRGNKK
jgi:hypothetical protein